VFFSCGGDAEIDDEMQPKITLEEKNEAIKLLENNCYSCHAPNNSSPRLAPPMFAVKNHYYNEGVSEKEFVESITAYAINPAKENSRMPGAVSKFGLMPQSNFNADDVRIIAKYLFYGDIKHPNDCGESAVELDTLNYLEIGKTAAMQVKTVLGKNLFAAIEKEGPAGAVEFCNIEAVKITDSVSVSINSKVKRVSDRPRNQDNKANDTEVAIMKSMKASLKSGTQVSPQLVEVEDKVLGYYPILTNGMCLQCHGNPNENIETKTLEKLGYLYPNDKAIGYSENELRGMFVVEMDKM
jgi:nitrate reductase cytochrome c-type subunit